MKLDSRKMSEQELVAALAAERARLAESAPTSAEQLIHELSVYQIELEMQNRELRRTQLALEESSSKYADLYDLAPVGYCTLDREGRVLEANLRAAELFATTRSELIGRVLTANVAAADRKAFRDHLRSCLNREASSPCVLNLEARGRAQICVELVSTPLFDGTGATSACKTTLHDITDAKLSERRLGLLAKASEVLSSSLDVSTTFGEVVRLTVPLLADRASFDIKTGTAVRSFTAGAGERVPLHAPSSPQAGVMKSGDPIYGDTLMCLPLRARGATLGVLTLEVDGPDRIFSLADIKAAESLASRAAMAVDNAQLYRDAQAAARAREDLLAMVSHDLKNPLQAIRLNAEFLSRVPGVQDQRSVDSISRSVAGMQAMIEDLLDLARIEAGHLLLARRDYDPADVIADVMELIQPLADSKHIRLHSELPTGSVTVHGDRSRMSQVLSNVVGNAIKYTNAGGTISVELSLADGVARFVVRDNGVGIARDQLPHVFDRYWQGANHQKGSGLGLYIAQGIIGAHGGQIEIDSQLGGGTTVSFWVPGASRAISRPNPAHEGAILIVDDDPEIRGAMAMTVEGFGYHVETAADGREALALCLGDGRHRPDLLLVDLQMPGMTGWELCAALKGDPRLASIPIVLLSAAPDLQEEAGSLGAAGYLQKPVRVEALLEAVQLHCRPSAPAAP